MSRRDIIKTECEKLAKASVKRLGFRAWYDEAKKVLTHEEIKEVDQLWETMPGSSTWMDAFLKWMSAPETIDLCNAYRYQLASGTDDQPC